MRLWKPQTWPHSSDKSASGKPGAVQSGQHVVFWLLAAVERQKVVASHVGSEPNLHFRQSSENGCFAMNSRGLTPRVCRNM